ncbi:MAG: flagellar biosynthesis protein FlhA [Candidatus Coatesbacteria bacterium]|nr:flagellar biosynthesis protein FlhA [Candidatus Coatesbacteria bacterium]
MESLIGKYYTRVLKAHSHLVLPLGVIVGLVAIVVPLPSAVLDFLITLNITLSIVILLVSMYIENPVSFSVFPSILLLSTFYRLTLNIASTRLILTRGDTGQAAAGQVIRAFGQFVAQGGFEVGIVLFLIIIAVQFIVINHGAVRTSEVTARFTLDALPGKQMSIDADLSAGMIDEREARHKRQELSDEAEFYGAMDGAIRFTARDALAALMITVVNIVAGLAIGVAFKGKSIGWAAANYTILTVGDGLVAAIPALFISLAGGLMTTRAAAKSNLGQEITSQILYDHRPWFISSAALVGFALVPGLPVVPFATFGVMAGGLAYIIYRQKALEKRRVEEKVPEAKPPERVETLMRLDPLELEVGYGLIRLVDESQGGDLLSRIKAIRRQFALDLGLVVPPVRIRDNLELAPNEYRILLRGSDVGGSRVLLDHYLAMNPGTVVEEIEGTETVEPTFGLPALWIAEEQREGAQLSGYTVVDTSTIIATHISEIIKTHADELLTRQDVQNLLDQVAETHPKLVDEIKASNVGLGLLLKVLKGLLRERVSIRDRVSILEGIADALVMTRDPTMIVELVRIKLGRMICMRYRTPEGELPVIAVSPEIEQIINDAIQSGEHTSFLALEPAVAERLLGKVRETIDSISSDLVPVVLCSASVRRHLRYLVERFMPNVVVLSHNEIPTDFKIRSLGLIGS